MLLTDILPRAASGYPDVPAVRCGDHVLSYRSLATRVARLASAFADLGVGRGDRVALLHRNCHRVMETYFAAVHTGAVLVPLNHRLTADDLAYIIDETSSRVLIVDDGWAALGVGAARRAQTATTLVCSSVDGHALPAGFEHDYGRLVASSETLDLEGHDAAEDDPVNIYYTSGTTGHQKGVVLTHRNVASHAMATIAELHLGDGDVWAHVAPMFHLADAWAVWALTWVGARHVMVERFDPAAVLRTMVEQRVTVTNLIPTMLNDMVSCPEVESIALPDFRLVMSGGAPISPRLVERVVETFGCEYAQTYGLTETSPYLTFSLLKDHLRRLPGDEQMKIRAKTGRPALGVEVRVRDEAGQDVPNDGSTVGEVVARGDRVTPGYWQNPEATSEAFDGRGFFHTGDLATVDAEGYLNIVDRKKDVILTGGELVYSTEVENVLYEHPWVFEAAVVARPDERMGEAVQAVVVLHPGRSITSFDLVAFCRIRLAHYKCPRSVVFVDSLPRTGSGKISKQALREMMAERAGSS